MVRLAQRHGLPPAVFLTAALVGCGLWYAKNWALSGNPVYPLVLGGTDRTPELVARWNRAHRVPPDERGRCYSVPQAAAAASDFGWRNPWQSPLLVPLVAAALLCAPQRRLVLSLAVYAGFCLAVWWLVTHRVDRFWVPLLPVLAWLAGIGADWPAERTWQRAVTVLLVTALTVNVLFLLSAGVYDHRYLVSLERLRLDEPAEPGGLSRVRPAHRYLTRYVVHHIRVLTWRSQLCGVQLVLFVDIGQQLRGAPHKLAYYNVFRNAISPLSSRHGFFGLSSWISQFTKALAFISRSTSAYTFVVLRHTWPSQARMVLMSTPDRSRCVAVVWRIVWGLTRFFASEGIFSATSAAWRSTSP